MNLKNLALIAFLPFSLTAQAGLVLPADNLLANGGFEDAELKTGSWKYYKNGHNGGVDLGWDYGQSAMEIWNTPFLGVQASEGSKLAELNAHGANGAAYSFAQAFDTIIGQTYNYGFAYRARNHSSESFYAGIEGVDANTLFDDHTRSGWSYFNGSFVADSTSSTIIFTSNDRLGDTTGNLIDGVYVTSEVPEPGTMALMALGIVGLTFSRVRKI